MAKQIICPKHKEPLAISSKSISFADSSYTVCIGSCPKCSVQYISKHLIPGSGVTIDGQKYVYLSELPSAADVFPKQPNAKEKGSEKKPQNMDDIENYFLAAEKEIQQQEEHDQLVEQNRLLLQQLTRIRRRLTEVESQHQKQISDLLSAHKAELNSTVTEYQLRIERLNRLHQSAIDEVQKNAHAELDAERHRVSQLRHDNAALSKQVESLSKQLAKAKGPVRQAVFVDEKLYICGGTIKCEKYSHDIEEVTGIIDTVRGNPVSMTVCHCKSCKLYYVRDTVFESYREKYGALLGKFVRQADGMKMGLITAYGELALESLLHMNGYNVNQTDNLSPGERRKILTYVIESHIMSRYDIRNHLSYLVKMNQYNPSKSIAVSRWKSDIQWVNDYHIDKQDTVWLSGTAMYKHWHKS